MELAYKSRFLFELGDKVQSYMIALGVVNVFTRFSYYRRSGLSAEGERSRRLTLPVTRLMRTTKQSRGGDEINIY